MSLIIYLLVLFSLIFGLQLKNENDFISSLSYILLILNIFFLITYLTIKNFSITINFITIWFGFQRYIALVLANISSFSIEAFKIFFLIKEVLFIFIFILLFILYLFKIIKIKLLLCDKFLILYSVLLFVSLFISPGAFWLKILSLRRFIILPLIYFIGRLSNITLKNIKNTIIFLIIFSLILCLYGLFDYFGDRMFLYTNVFNIDGYFLKQVYAGFIPARFVGLEVLNSGIFTDYTLNLVKPRFLSTYLEPTTFGSYLAFVFCIFTFNYEYLKIIKIENFLLKSIFNYFICFLLLICIVLTFSKGALIILLCSSSFILYFNKNIPLLYRKVYFITVYLSIILSVLICIIFPSGTSAHVNGLSSGIISSILHPLGLGLGNAGNYMEGSSVESIGAESAVGNMLAQLGLIGFLPYLCFVISVIKILITKYELILLIDKNKAMLIITILGLFIGYLVNSLFTESALGVSGNLYYFLYLGIIITYLQKFQRKEIL